jgi:hypothetical protein
MSIQELSLMVYVLLAFEDIPEHISLGELPGLLSEQIRSEEEQVILIILQLAHTIQFQRCLLNIFWKNRSSSAASSSSSLILNCLVKKVVVRDGKVIV